jgi:hypothetical protein
LGNGLDHEGAGSFPRRRIREGGLALDFTLSDSQTGFLASYNMISTIETMPGRFSQLRVILPDPQLRILIAIVKESAHDKIFETWAIDRITSRWMPLNSQNGSQVDPSP